MTTKSRTGHLIRFILVARSITPVRPSQTYVDGDIEPSTFLCQKRELWLTRWQRDKCEKNNQRHTYAAAIQGIRRAGHECKVRFRNELWNCPDLHSELKNHLHDESSIFSFGTKQAAYANAILAASVTHSVSLACQKGMIPSVQCSSPSEFGYDLHHPTEAQRRKLRESIKNGDMISPPINYDTHWDCFDKCQNLGKKISEEFLLEHGGYDDRGSSKSNLQTIAEMNQKRGRNIVTDDLVNNRRKTRVCHGISGTCAFATYIPKSPSYEEVANRIYREYRTAREVERCNDPFHGCDIHKLGDELFFTDKDTNYCDAQYNHDIGYGGMTNRKCRLSRKQLEREEKRENKKSKKRRKSRNRKRNKDRDKNKERNRREKKRKKDANRLPKCGRPNPIKDSQKPKKNDVCCNRGYRHEHRREEYECNCVFHWCCHVECEKCHRNVTLGVCNEPNV